MKGEKCNEEGRGGYFQTVVGDRGCVIAALACSLREPFEEDLFLLRKKNVQLLVKRNQEETGREKEREGERVFTCLSSQPIYGELIDVGKIQLPNEIGVFLDVLVLLSRDEHLFFLSFDNEGERFNILHKINFGEKERREEGRGKQLLKTLSKKFPSPLHSPSSTSLVNIVGVSQKDGTILILSSLLSSSSSPSSPSSSPPLSFLPSPLSSSSFSFPKQQWTDKQHTFFLSLSSPPSPPPIIWDFCLFSPSCSLSLSPSTPLSVFVGVICSSYEKKIPVVRLFWVSLTTNNSIEIPFQPTKKYFFPHKIVPFSQPIDPLGPTFLISEPSGRISVFRISGMAQEIGNCSLCFSTFPFFSFCCLLS